ncbi:hypothetical protein [Streptomyces sp. KLOTTS4A1]|uniref:hypothetical protein n=1 Tax=Streptomyces sp. KLOTTS4A1 TaxID=3390996 RepID=UPI0039F57CBA
MRLRRALVVGVCAAALTPVLLAAPARAGGAPPALADRMAPGPAGGPAAGLLQPTCAVAEGADFPVGTAIAAGAARSYRPGEGFRGWSVELSNDSDTTCRRIHPILILLGREPEHELGPAQAEFEFRTPDGDWHPVKFERASAGEYVGVFDDGFGGFTLPAGDAVTVPVRLRFTEDARPGRVTASLAVVQRQADDGEWVGESEDYEFVIAGDGDGGGDTETETDSPQGVEAALEELAKTGRSRDEALLRLGVAACAFLLGGGALVVGSRRRFRRR